MVRIFTNDDSGKVCVEWHSKSAFYKVLNAVKSTVGAIRQGRTWKVDATELKGLLKQLAEFKGETVHVDVRIFHHITDYIQSRKGLLDLRNALEGIDSGVEFVEPYAPLPFQHIGIEFINTVRNGLIADKVGLGKTIQGFGAAVKMYQEGKIEKAMIVVPATMKEKWRRDIEKFLGVDAMMLEGTKEQRVLKYRKWQKSDDLFCIVSYDTIKRDVLLRERRGSKSILTWDEDSYVAEYTKKRFVLIMDEVQKIRNFVTARGKCCKALSKMAQCYSRVGLSATYVETGLEDLFGVMMVIDNTVFGESAMRFESAFISRDFMGKIRDYKNVNIATEKMKYVAVRRNKEQVKDQLQAHLPKVNESTLWVEMSAAQKKISNEILKRTIEVMKDIEKQERINMATALSEMIYLRQAAVSAELIDPDVKVSSKIDTLLDILPPIVEENKAVIFCFFTGFVDAMERELTKEGMKCIAMHGKRREGHQKERQRMVDKFSDGDYQVLLTSDILAEGIDIPAASYVINTDTLWNPAKMIQRCGRIDRLNQQADNIYDINIWSKDSIEEQMFEVIYKRLELATQVIDGGVTEQRYKRISFGDLKQMLRNLGGKI